MTKPLGARQCPEKRREFPKHTHTHLLRPAEPVRLLWRAHGDSQLDKSSREVFAGRHILPSPVRVLLRPMCTGFRLCVWVRRSLF